MASDPVAFAAARLVADRAAAARAQALRDRLDDPHRQMTQRIRDGAEHAWRETTADPARMLREVEAGRRILERHRDCATMSGWCRDRHVGPPPCPDLADLLTRWDGHSGYRQEWADGLTETVPDLEA